MKWNLPFLIAIFASCATVTECKDDVTNIHHHDDDGGSRREEGDDYHRTSARRSTTNRFLQTMEETCTCNANTGRLAGGIPPLDATESVLTYPNIALEAAYIGFALIPGTGAEPHKLAMLGTAMYEAMCILSSPTATTTSLITTNRTPLTNAGIAQKEQMMMTMMTEDEVNDFIGYAAYGALRRLISNAPEKVTTLDMKMTALGFDSSIVMTHAETSSFVMEILMKYSPGPPGQYNATNPPSTLPIDAECETLVDPTKWQPQCLGGSSGGGDDDDDNSCTPQQIPFLPLYNAKLISANGERTVLDLIRDIPPAPTVEEDGDYVEENRQVLEASAILDDRTKFVAEYFQPNAAVRFGMVTINEAEARNLSLEDSIEVFFAVTGAGRDTVAGSVTLKVLNDFVRPITVLQCHSDFRGQTLLGWTRPYRGVQSFVNDANNDDDENDDSSSTLLWRPYLQTPPHPGYTSGHAGVAGAESTVLNLFFSDGLMTGNNCATQGVGTSRTEPRLVEGQVGYIAGVTDVPNQGPMTVGFAPATDVTLCWTSYDDFAEQLAFSRLVGGIHVPADNSNGLLWGKIMGQRFYDFVMDNRKVNEMAEEEVAEEEVADEEEANVPMDESTNGEEPPLDMPMDGVEEGNEPTMPDQITEEGDVSGTSTWKTFMKRNLVFACLVSFLMMTTM